MKRFYVGFTGLAGAGKSEAAKYLSKIAANFPTTKVLSVVPFAKSLKDVAKSMGWDGKKDERGRRLLQLLGTECGRECIGEDVWVNIWGTVAGQQFDGAISDDTRFDNEIQRIKDMGGVIVKIVGRGHYVKKGFLAPVWRLFRVFGFLCGVAGHASENVPDYCDLEIDNSGSHGDLQEAIENFWTDLKEGKYDD